MEILFKELKIQGFKNHPDLVVNFGEVTKIGGDNGKGKSTVVESPCWLLYSTDPLGNKLDPTPITYAADETLVQLLITVDGKQFLLGKGLKKGKTQYYINEVPSKAGEFNELLDQLFDKDLFLSLYNPSYFPSLHWEKQRSMLLQYVSTPSSKEVFKNLPEAQTEVLERHLKKHSLEDLEKIHKDNKNKREKDYIARQARTKTLKEQLAQLTDEKLDIDSIQAELAQVDKQVRELEEKMDAAFEKNNDFNRVQSQIRALQDQIEMSKEQWPLLKNEPIEDTCPTCKMVLNEEAVEAVKTNKENRLTHFKNDHNARVKQRDNLKEKLNQIEFVDVTDLREKIKEHEEKTYPLREQVRIYSQYKNLETQVKSSEADENGTLQDLKGSIFILDSIKAFKAKEAELQGEKVQSLFERLSVRLFNEQKNGEIKPTFEIEMDGKPYSKLSLSESIRAGLELRDVLSKQSDLIVPCVVDNAESITSFNKPNGQLIVSRVIAGQELKIECESNSKDIVVDIEVIS